MHDSLKCCGRCVVAYASDLIFLGVSLNPHRKMGLKTTSLSLDHSYVSIPYVLELYRKSTIRSVTSIPHASTQ